MGVGIAMAMSGDHSQVPVHVHLNTLGWLSMTLFGLVYHVVPDMAWGRLPRWHLGASATGLALMLPALVMIGMGQHEKVGPLAGAGAMLTILGMALFAVQVFRATSSARRAAALPAAE
ncbi:hypothetical protein HHL28_08415 [Aerophototrophica crusticola]|uniref:Cytochrome-c oxidase n=1 Tax=Aerophototrophica crusticola TaxID=1709002 RepID=A0A858R6P5_9PROT|nr:hypothetical protein HHL28_08415 [Rhodospirillaceae bacterium B3]